MTLDARMAMQEYQSVYGWVEALIRFADSVLEAISVSENAQASGVGQEKGCA
jgi:hypothetical protein